ncbi:MAG TPA: peptide deformylase [Niabella sp.]|nr:peptide deformylase [Niabella sp.]HQW14679.1 peptide deformylase [Niabella sp.]HQX19818.1 peptide deformylase [Niabella sp.]HQX42283.1 peptide deformylase [Niabella sp.]HRB08336.1 peptide deformylase [Niabella sp.]
MILPIVAYGNPILRKVAKEIDPEYTGLKELIANMWETMYASNGVGLAAPQINKPIRLFVVDSEQIIKAMVEDEDEDLEKYPGDLGIKQEFINAYIKELNGEPWIYNEGCLSIPKIRGDIKRPESVTLEFEDENFNLYTQTFTGITARVILHEYDHIEGKLFIDHLPALKRKLLKSKLNDISNGKIRVDYRMSFS